MTTFPESHFHTRTVRYISSGACLLLLLLVTACHPKAPTPAVQPPPPPPPPPPAAKVSIPIRPPPNATPDELACIDTLKLINDGKTEEALQSINAVLAANPKNISAYMLQAQIYSTLKRWSDAEAGYNTVLKIDEKNVAAQFDLSELKFLQKDYEGARPGFVALKNDPNLGDFVAYKVFLCDLLGGKDDVARSELDVFNQMGGNASYYFGNVAWCVYHHDDAGARDWLTSAGRIYSLPKIERYTFSLRDLGYLPLAAPKPDAATP